MVNEWMCVLSIFVCKWYPVREILYHSGRTDDKLYNNGLAYIARFKSVCTAPWPKFSPLT